MKEYYKIVSLMTIKKKEFRFIVDKQHKACGNYFEDKQEAEITLSLFKEILKMNKDDKIKVLNDLTKS